MHLVSFCIGQCALQAPVINAVAHALPVFFGVRELVDELDVLNQATSNVPDDLHDVVFVERRNRAACCRRRSGRGRRQPERDVLVARGALGEGLETGDLACLELREESLVAGPEETDIRNVEEEHGNPFQAESKGPPDAVGHVRVDEEILFDYTTAQDFQPIPLPENFKLPGGTGKGEVRLDPSDLEGLCLSGGGRVTCAGGRCFARFAEDLDDHLLQRPLEMRRDSFHLFSAVMLFLERVTLRMNGWVLVLDDDIMRRDAVQIIHNSGSRLCRIFQRFLIRALPQHRALHLMEDGIVAAVNRISPEHVCDHGVSTFLWARALIAVYLLEICLLVCAGMRPQKGVLIDIVGIRTTAARMILREAQDIEIILDRDNRDFLGVISIGWTRKLAFDKFACDRERVILLKVESASDVG